MSVLAERHTAASRKLSAISPTEIIRDRVSNDLLWLIGIMKPEIKKEIIV
jgi:hypothetical protein